MLDLMLVRTEKEPDDRCDWRWFGGMFAGAVAFMIDAIRKQCYLGKGYSFGLENTAAGSKARACS
jgi:hypothetical protein